MPKTKYEFTRSNNIRKEQGLESISWAEYISDSPPKKLGRLRMEESEKKPQSRRTGMYSNFLPDEKKEIIRPSAIYDNQSYTSIFEKYGI